MAEAAAVTCEGVPDAIAIIMKRSPNTIPQFQAKLHLYKANSDRQK